MIDEYIFIREPVNFQNKFLIYPPSIREVLALQQKFNAIRKVLTISQEELEDEFVDKTDLEGNSIKVPTPMEYLFKNSEVNKDFAQVVKDAFMFFIHENVTLLTDRKEILIGEISKIKSLEKVRLLKEENYFDFQNQIRLCLGEKAIEPPRPDEDPRVKRIKAKARLRDRIKAEKGLGISLKTSMVSLCCMGLGITPLNIGELAYGALNVLIKQYQAKEKYETDVASLMAGADSKKVKPKYWIRNLND